MTCRTNGQFDVLLISPHTSYRSDGRPRFSSLELSDVVPLGLLSIAQFLHAQGLRVKLLHLPSEHEQPFEEANWDLDAILAGHAARVVGIQAHWYLYCNGAIQIADRYRRIHPGARIYLGGQFASAMAEQFLRACPALDGVVDGEGEIPMLRLARAAAEGGDPGSVPGCWHRNHDAVRHSPASGNSLVPMRELPLLDPGCEPFDNIAWWKRTYINITRGRCPCRCGYCVANYQPFYRRPLVLNQTDRVIEQIRIYDEHGFNELFLGETEFLSPRYRTQMMELADRIQSLRPNLTFSIEGHPGMFSDPDLARRLVRAGFLRFSIGAESGSTGVLRRIGRNSTRDEILRAVRNISAAGGLVQTSWICNLPGETDAEFGESLDTMKQVADSGGQIYWIDPLIVLPDTPFSRCPQAHQIQPLLNSLEDWQRWSLLAKNEASTEDLRANPLRYLTHVNLNTSPEVMIDRFIRCRSLAVELVPQMKANAQRVLSRSGNAHAQEQLQDELGVLEDYAGRLFKILVW